ncbi:EamA family transporter [Halomarina ordinaria]|uniref:EamA family transporter n=1 Tax=Halomarina ordinaria TaxID=3033939 RepID=A0ABD5UBK9_9EURY|nr:EamA family transporter [Halomarina sp. PSRA2]
MNDNYLVWSVVALLGYTAFTPLAQLATSSVPSYVVALVANTILAVSALGVALYQRGPILVHVTGDAGVYMLAAGAFLTVGILAYYEALATGPVSVVVPIFGMFIVGSSVLGLLFLGDELTARKGLGIALACVAVYLTATG